MSARLSPRPGRCKETSAIATILIAFVAILCVQPALHGNAFSAGYEESHVVPAGEKSRLIQLIKIIKSGEADHGKIIDQKVHSKHPLSLKIIEWSAFQNVDGNLPFGKISSFITNNTDWPGIAGLRLQAEANFPERVHPAIVVSWFKKYPPLTAQGMYRYMSSLLSLGHRKKLRVILNNWWATSLIPVKDQKLILSRFSPFIDRETQIRRLDKLLLHGHYTNGRQIAGLLGHDYMMLAEARIALAAGKSGVDSRISRVPDYLKNDNGLKFERLRWRRKKNMNLRAIEMLRQAPPPEEVINPFSWWRERHIITRRLVKEKAYEKAYRLVSLHRQKDGLALAQAEWLAGWIALQHLNRHYEAFQHFRKLYQNVSTPISRARGAYWAGLSALQGGDRKTAGPWLEAAARHPETFYGQIALSLLKKHHDFRENPLPEISERERIKWKNTELFQAASIFHEAKLYEETGDFLNALVSQATKTRDMMVLADMAQKLGHYDTAISISRTSQKNGIKMHEMHEYAFPFFPSWMEAVNTEPALVHALILQESAFNPRATSPAGARGLMQLMPATASMVARKKGIPHHINWLTTKPQHNIALGTAYLEELLPEFGGSYILALAAYNAGPNRVRRWVKEYGDPHSSGTDPVDWIEMIPVYETRNYVQRVLEAIYVYRAMNNIREKHPAPNIHVSFDKH